MSETLGQQIERRELLLVTMLKEKGLSLSERKDISDRLKKVRAAKVILTKPAKGGTR